MSVTTKIRKGIKNPRMAFSYVVNRLYYLFKKKRQWTESSGGLKRKQYDTYDEYVEHQKSKFPKVKSFLKEEYDTKYRIELRKRLQKYCVVKLGMNALCLAARLGTEVKSFIDLGCFAIGLDLNPGHENKYVVTGDFHHIQFADSSVDIVFTNSLDHAFNLDKLAKEIKRVTKPGGNLILEIVKGEEEGVSPSYYESVYWNTVEDVLRIFARSGFKVLSRHSFTYPWKGEHISFVLHK